MKICYKEKRFKKSSILLIDQAQKIIEDYQRQGFSLTLRQLYYQFVSRDLIPNKQSEYKRLGAVINDARLAGLISWRAIEDRTRNLKGLETWDSPNEIIENCAYSFAIDMWENQDNYAEVWIEKDALVGVISKVCNDLRVNFFACRGYTSQSEQWAAGRRMARMIEMGKDVHLLHLGDHDPSGIDMTRDNEDRLRMFIGRDADSDQFHVHRLALNMDQVKKHKPPPNPAKMTDSRFNCYASKFGQKSWELDALEPRVIAGLIRTSVNNLIDQEQWDDDEEREESYKSKLRDIARNTDF